MKEINLLPKQKQQEISLQAVLRDLYRIVALSVLSFAVVILTLLGAKLYLQRQLGLYQERVALLKSQVSRGENSEVRKQITDLNNRIGDYYDLSESTPKWSRVLKAFAVLPPQGVKIKSFVLNLGQKSIQITGFSPTREKVIETYNSILADSKDFYNIDYPLENVAKATDIDFHFTFYVNDDLLK